MRVHLISLLLLSSMFLMGQSQSSLVLKDGSVLLGDVTKVNLSQVRITTQEGENRLAIHDVKAIVYPNKIVDRQNIFGRFTRKAYRRNYYRKLELFYHTGEYERWKKAYQFEVGYNLTFVNLQDGIKIQFAQQLHHNLYLIVPFSMNVSNYRADGYEYHNRTNSSTDTITQV